MHRYFLFFIACIAESEAVLEAEAERHGFGASSKKASRCAAR